MKQQFETNIEPRRKWFDLKLNKLWEYRELIFLFVKRNFIAKYKQTVLGPMWAIIQPLLSTVVITVIFGNFAGLAPNGVPMFAFYFCGSILWSYFSSCVVSVSRTFISNSNLFSKAYFPRLVMPISSTISNLISFAIQFIFFIGFLAFYLLTDANLRPNLYILLAPFVLLQTAMLSIGIGTFIAALTTKYKDLIMVVSFGVQLWMYASPIAYDISVIPRGFLNFYMLNPITPPVLIMRYAFLGVGEVNLKFYIISLISTLLIFSFGILLFNRAEKNFMDTI